MKIRILFISVIVSALLFFSNTSFGQAPNLGTASDFELFTSVGAVTNTGISQITGNVGTNSGSSTGFGNVNGVMHDNDGASGQCATDVLAAYNQLAATISTASLANLLGNGQMLFAGVYSIASATIMNDVLVLDAQGDANAVFIFQIQGTFGANTNAKVKLINGALACNVFWNVNNAVSLASGVSMKGTIISGGAITMNALDTLEGRALTTAGLISIDGVLAYTPIGCGSPVHIGPMAPTLNSIVCYALFSSIGPVTNLGISFITGDVGTNDGLTLGHLPIFVTGDVHFIPDGGTVQAASDLLNVYNYLNTLPDDIELLYPAQLGNNLVLTPHTYIMNGITTFTDTLFLNAEGDANAVFVIKVKGAFSTSTFSNVKLINEAKAENVFWVIDGAVDINNFSTFNGTIICNNGAISLNFGTTLNGRALTTNGALSSSAITAIIPSGCSNTYAPTVTIEPANGTACVSGPGSLSVTATGTNLTYQWRKGTVDLVNGINISGVHSSVLKVNSVTAADTSSIYNVVVSGAIAPNDTSNYVSLLFDTIPTIITHPTNRIACVGDTIRFSTVAIGSGLTYQWRKGTIDLHNSLIISGATSDTLVINGVSVIDVAADYNVIVKGKCTPNDTSNNASLTVNTAPVALASSNSTVCTGSSIELSAQTVTSGTYFWTGPTGFSSSVQNPVIIAASSANVGTYSLTVSRNGCLSAPTTTTVGVANCADLSIVKTVSSTHPIIGHTVVFTIVVTNNGHSTATGLIITDTLKNGYTYVSSTATKGTFNPSTGSWTISTLNEGETATLKITATVMATGDYSNTATITSDQVDNDSVNNTSLIVTIPTDFNIPEGFSPDADGINDVYVIRGIDSYPTNTFTVFNRWGVKVFDASPYINTWDGKSTKGVKVGGDELPVATYFYVLDLGDGSASLKGTIYLNK
jgi:uncharacterized repeat protein (TIGR01451 family)/gliding motility-associated-like protein